MNDLDRAAESLAAARHAQTEVFVLCAMYVERHAAAGDPDAVALYALVTSARDTVAAEAIAASSALEVARADGR